MVILKFTIVKVLRQLKFFVQLNLKLIFTRFLMQHEVFFNMRPGVRQLIAPEPRRRFNTFQQHFVDSCLSYPFKISALSLPQLGNQHIVRRCKNINESCHSIHTFNFVQILMVWFQNTRWISINNEEYKVKSMFRVKY